jgi:phage/plasmid-associated DNA primase
MENRFEAFNLYGKKVAAIGETNFGLLQRTDLIKRLCGNDPVTFEAKNKGAFKGRNTAKLIISSNSLPTSDDRSDGFYRRFLILNFPYQFKEKVDLLSNIPEYEYENLAKWCVDNLPNILANGGFHNEGDIIERKNKYILASNPLPIFIEKCCDVEHDNSSVFVSSSLLHSIYVKALTNAKKRAIGKKEFHNAMSDAGFYSEKINRSMSEGDYFNGYAYIGIKLKKDYQSIVENCFVTNVTNVTHFTTSPITYKLVVNHVTNVTNVTKSKVDVLDYVHQYGKEGLPLTDVLNRCVKQQVEELIETGDLVEMPAGIIKSSKALYLNEEDIL